MTRIPLWLSTLGLLLVMVLGTTYLALAVLKVDPTVERTHATVDLRDAGGLRAGSDVVYRGVPIGRVDSIDGVPGAVRLRVSYDAGYRIPVESRMRVENLSTLGEPVFSLLPDTTDGPYIEDGAILTEQVELPTSVPELLSSTSDLLDQTDVEAVRSLVDALAQTVDGLEATLPEARRGAELLLLTLQRHEGSLDRVLRDFATVMGDVEWVRPTLTEAPPMLDQFGETLGVSYDYLFEGSQVLRGEEILGSWRDEQEQLYRVLGALSPEVGAIGSALRPVTGAVGPSISHLDIATLLENAVATMPDEAVRFTVTMPR